MEKCYPFLSFHTHNMLIDSLEQNMNPQANAKLQKLYFLSKVVCDLIFLAKMSNAKLKWMSNNFFLISPILPNKWYCITSSKKMHQFHLIFVYFLWFSMHSKWFIYSFSCIASVLSAYGSFNHSAIFFHFVWLQKKKEINLLKQLCKLFVILFLHLYTRVLMFEWRSRWKHHRPPIKSGEQNKTAKERQHYWHIANITNNKYCIYLQSAWLYADFQCGWNEMDVYVSVYMKS